MSRVYAARVGHPESDCVKLRRVSAPDSRPAAEHGLRFRPSPGLGFRRASGVPAMAVSAAARVAERVIMQQTGHKTVASLRRYIRKGKMFRENAAAGLGI